MRLTNMDEEPDDPRVTDEEWAAAKRVADDAVAGFAALLPAAQLMAYRAELIAHMVADPEGRALLRRTLADPEVDASGALPKDPPRDAGATALSSVDGAKKASG